jgi:hypothetical protein
MLRTGFKFALVCIRLPLLVLALALSATVVRSPAAKEVQTTNSASLDRTKPVWINAGAVLCATGADYVAWHVRGERGALCMRATRSTRVTISRKAIGVGELAALWFVRAVAAQQDMVVAEEDLTNDAPLSASFTENGIEAAKIADLAKPIWLKVGAPMCPSIDAAAAHITGDFAPCASAPSGLKAAVFGMPMEGVFKVRTTGPSGVVTDCFTSAQSLTNDPSAAGI